MNHIMNRFN